VVVEDHVERPVVPKGGHRQAPSVVRVGHAAGTPNLDEPLVPLVPVEPLVLEPVPGVVGQELVVEVIPFLV
jgi:hypothetical protein